MTKSDLTIALRFRSDAEMSEMIGEADVVAAFEADAEAKPEYGDHIGQVVFNPGAEEIFIGGTMLWLIPKFCIDVPDYTYFDGEITFEMADSEAEATFRRMEDQIIMTGSEDDTNVAFPTLPFMEGMLAAAERYAGICATLWPEDSAPDVEMIRDDVARIREEMAEEGG